MENVNDGQLVYVNPWDGHPFYPVPEGVEEETFDFMYEVTVGSGLTQIDVPLRVDADSDFQVRGIQGEYFGVGGGIAEIMFTDPSGDHMSNLRIIFDAFVPASQQNLNAPWFPETRIPANGLMLIDVEETSGLGSTSVRIVLVGVKRRRAAARACDYPPAAGVDNG